MPGQAVTIQSDLSCSGICRKSAEGCEHLRVRWEPACRLLRVGEPVIHGDLEDTTAGPSQLYLRARCRLLNQTCRRTGARFIASHSAIFDLDLHNLLPGCRRAYRNDSHAPFHVAARGHGRNATYITMHTVSIRVHPDLRCDHAEELHSTAACVPFSQATRDQRTHCPMDDRIPSPAGDGAATYRGSFTCGLRQKAQFLLRRPIERHRGLFYC
jgi:hypothetical protein